MGTQYTICRWAINRSDPQNLLSVTLDVPLHLACLLVILKHTSLAPITETLNAEPVYSVEHSSRSLILISEDSPRGELYHNY